MDIMLQPTVQRGQSAVRIGDHDWIGKPMRVCVFLLTASEYVNGQSTDSYCDREEKNDACFIGEAERERDSQTERERKKREKRKEKKDDFRFRTDAARQIIINDGSIFLSSHNSRVCHRSFSPLFFLLLLSLSDCCCVLRVLPLNERCALPVCRSRHKRWKSPRMRLFKCENLKLRAAVSSKSYVFALFIRCVCVLSFFSSLLLLLLCLLVRRCRSQTPTRRMTENSMYTENYYYCS